MATRVITKGFRTSARVTVTSTTPSEAPSENDAQAGCQPDCPEDSSSSDKDSEEEAGEHEIPSTWFDSPKDSAEEAGHHVRFTPGKRKRYDQAGKADFEIKERLCFKGGFLQKPIVLDIVSYDTERAEDKLDMLKVTGRAEWLCQAATGQVTQRGSFEAGVANVKVQLGQAIAQPASAIRLKKLSNAVTSRLNVVEDSDSSSASIERRKPGGKRSKIRVDNPPQRQIHDIKFGGATFKAVVSTGGRSGEPGPRV